MPALDRRHYGGSYRKRAARVVAAAYRDALTRCWRCGRTLAEHPPHKTGRRARWTAGHTIDGDSSAPLLPEVSTCNSEAGARHGNLPVSRRWY